MTIMKSNLERLGSIQLNEERFLALLEKLVSVTPFLQNNPSQGMIPQEDRAGDFVLEALKPYMRPNGPLIVERITYVEGRGNIMIRYPGSKKDKVCSFVGSHLDVVPATAATWERDPFKLIIEGDSLYGRGTTDCLGHVAVITDLFISLAQLQIPLETSVVAIFIANEENSEFQGVGIDQLVREQYMDCLKTGPLFWVDSADSQPCVGTAGIMQWQLDLKGKLCHSGLPHRGVNSIEFAQDAVAYLQTRFYSDFGPHPDEHLYNFLTCSTLKPTQISCSVGSLNQIPPTCLVQGDIRLTPFYDVAAVKAAVEQYVLDINADPAVVESGKHGPHSKYVLEDGTKGSVSLTWLTKAENGVACDMLSKGYKALNAAAAEVLGVSKHYGISGSLPLIRDMKDLGFDVQIIGFGQSQKYHADNESASLIGMKNGARILAKVVAGLESA